MNLPFHITKSLIVLGSVTITFFLVCASSHAQTQESAPKYEVGLHYAALKLTEKSDTDGGFGVRFTYNVNDYLGLEAETTYFPSRREGSDGNERQGSFGVRAGKRSERFGVFAKVRPGVTRFYELGNTLGPNVFARGNTRFAFDVGGVFEYYPDRHAAVRVDVGDTMVRFKTGDFFFQGFERHLVQGKLSHNLQVNVGFAFRF